MNKTKRLLSYTSVLLVTFVVVFFTTYYFFDSFVKPIEVTQTEENGVLGSQSGSQSQAQFMHGAELLKTDISSASEILNKLAADESADPYYRVLAVNLLAQSISYMEEDVLANTVFSNDPSAVHLQDENFYRAQKNMYEWSLAIKPNFVAKLGSLLWYRHELKNNRTLGVQERQEYISHIEQGITSAEDLFMKELQEENAHIIGDARVYYALRGILSGTLYTETQNEAYKTDAIDSYAEALQLDPATGYGLMARYYYADFLRKTEGELAREKIEELLHGVVTTYRINPTITLFKILEKQKDIPGGERDDIVQTAAFYVPLSNILYDLGWTSEELEI